MTATSTETANAMPLLLCEIEVTRSERLSPSYVRLEFGSPELAECGVDGPLHDQRIKLVFPNAAGRLPNFEGANESWFDTWLDIPVEERGPMRTYTIRELRGAGAETRLVIDFVLHLGEGTSGPAAEWASLAEVGDRLVLLAPRRGHEFGGIEFAPGTARDLLLVGDETALPAIASILAGISPTSRGNVFVEVPHAGDEQELLAPDGVRIHWLARHGCDHGHKLVPAVRAHLGLPKSVDFVDPEAVDPDLWETPEYSSSGEEVDAVVQAHTVGHDFDGLYAWIAGESRVVTTLRRALVKELEIDRRQVAFMGYWRQGVAMRS